jgi:hypothetical protein
MVAHEVESNSAHRFREAIEKPVEVAKEYPVASMLVVFGVGLGVGVLLSQVACSSFAGMYHEPTFSERLSQQIYHAVNDVIPDSLRGQLARFQS